ncbi:signal peptidase II [Patescibacteria group bacterium]|nr:signal peptidase II [Patescibacteria group bacterium]
MQTKKTQSSRLVQVVLLLLPGSIVFCVDQIAKYFVRENIKIGDSIGSEYVNVSHYQNSGIAFGIPVPQFILYSLIGVVTALLLYYYREKLNNPFYAVIVSCIAGGALSNIVDRVTLGYVTDYLGVLIWPVFNIADVAIVCGVLLLGAKEFFWQKSV